MGSRGKSLGQVTRSFISLSGCLQVCSVRTPVRGSAVRARRCGRLWCSSSKQREPQEEEVIQEEKEDIREQTNHKEAAHKPALTGSIQMKDEEKIKSRVPVSNSNKENNKADKEETTPPSLFPKKVKSKFTKPRPAVWEEKLVENKLKTSNISVKKA